MGIGPLSYGALGLLFTTQSLQHEFNDVINEVNELINELIGVGGCE